MTLADLAAQMRGPLLRPGTTHYTKASVISNERYAAVHPHAIARAVVEDDVVACVRFAARSSLPFALRCGGHSYAGYSTNTGLVCDVRRLDTISVAADRRSVTVGAGVLAIDLITALAAHGLAVPTGSCPTVGISGLALGGGVGFAARAMGATCDTILAVRIVTADGRLRVADPKTNPDLLWACRGGGGGNFGVVTSFTFGTHPVGQIVLFFLAWPWSQAARVISAWQSWAPHAPDALWSNVHLAAAPGGSVPSIQVGGTYLGSIGAAAAQLEKLYAAAGSHPSSPFMENTSWLHAMLVEAGCASLTVNQCHLPTQDPAGRLSRASEYAKSDIFTKPLSSHGIGTLLAGVEKFQRAGGAAGGSGGIAFDALGGAVNRVAPGATAFVHRNALFQAQYTTTWPLGSPAAAVARQHAWQQSFWQSMRPFASGQAYQNYIDPALANWRQAYYGANLARLTQVKAKYDPNRVFRFPQAI
jgi:FAD/FMN-containing dehydrogenase